MHLPEMLDPDHAPAPATSGRRALPSLVFTLLAGVLVLGVTPSASAEEAWPALEIRSAPAGGVAGALFWPSAAELEGEVFAPGAALAAAEALLLEIETRWPGTSGEALALPEGLALVLEREEGAGALLAALAHAAAAADPGAERLEAAILRIHERARRVEQDALASTRRLALAALAPGLRTGDAALGGSAATEVLDEGQLRRVLDLVREAPLSLRLVGERPALEAALAARPVLGERLAPRPLPAPSAPPERTQYAALLPCPAGEEREAVGKALDLALDEVPGLDRAALMLLEEVLREGEGSLAQRLGVALPEGAAPRVVVSTERLGAERLALFLGAEAGRGSAEVMASIVPGSAESIAGLAPRRQALRGARQRLPEPAQDAGARLARWLRLGEPEAPRPDSGIGPEDLKRLAERLFDPERAAIVSCGARLSDQSGAPAERVVWADPRWSRFAPSGTLGPAGFGARQRARELAATLLERFGSGEATPLERGFRARFAVSENTPLGSGSLALTIERGAGGAWVRWEGDALALEADSQSGELRDAGKRGGVAALEGDHPEAGHALRRPGRLLTLVYMEPLVFAAAALEAPSAISPPSVDDEPRWIEIEPELGVRLRLVLDEASGRPDRLETWWGSGPASGPPDEVLRYLEWRPLGGLELAAKLSVRDRFEVDRSLALVDWAWLDEPEAEEGAPGEGEPPAAPPLARAAP